MRPLTQMIVLQSAYLKEILSAIHLICVLFTRDLIRIGPREKFLNIVVLKTIHDMRRDSISHARKESTDSPILYPTIREKYRQSFPIVNR